MCFVSFNVFVIQLKVIILTLSPLTGKPNIWPVLFKLTYFKKLKYSLNWTEVLETVNYICNMLQNFIKNNWLIKDKNFKVHFIWKNILWEIFSFREDTWRNIFLILVGGSILSSSPDCFKNKKKNTKFHK